MARLSVCRPAMLKGPPVRESMLGVAVVMEDRKTTTRSGGLLWRQHHRLATSLAAAGGVVEPQRLHEIERHETRQGFLVADFDAVSRPTELHLRIRAG
jgi:hypothetical protein